LKKMMEDDDEEEEVVTKPVEVKEREKSVEAKEEEPSVVVSGGRRRGRRRVMKKKTFRDEEGYLGMSSICLYSVFLFADTNQLRKTNRFGNLSLKMNQLLLLNRKCNLRPRHPRRKNQLRRQGREISCRSLERSKGARGLLSLGVSWMDE
jgi:hypothetical protein